MKSCGIVTEAMDGVPITQNNTPSTSTMPTTMEMVQTSDSSINPFNFMGMPEEFGMIGMNNYGIVSPFGMVNGQENMMVAQVKEVIRFSEGVLLPPNPNAPPPSTRDKPNGCRTIFVRGLPENVTKGIINEIFEKSGEIESIRLSRRKFCHIRFKDPASVERALYYSGYKLKIENSDAMPFIEKIHVDYAEARDDQRDYECLQRRLNRIACHKELEYFISTPPPPILHYTEHEATLIAEKLRNGETFLRAAYVLINWLDRGECTKWNAGAFYSMIQSTNSHVRQLITEKRKYEKQLNDAKEKLKKQMEGITHKFYEIEKVFKAACLQKVWDNFSTAQRKNIELWKKQTEEIKNAHVEGVVNEREDEEIYISEDENETLSQSTSDKSVDELKNQLEDEIAKLREENDSLRCQLEGAQQEIIVLQAETEEQLNRKEQKISSLCAVFQKTMKRCKKEANLLDFRMFYIYIPLLLLYIPFLFYFCKLHIFLEGTDIVVNLNTTL